MHERVSRAFITGSLPHGDGMCLIQEVVAWDAATIQILTRSHTADTHPLARKGGVHAIVAAEYAAQATAVHGALRDPDDPRREGRLASVRDLAWDSSDILDCLPARLWATERLRQDQAIVYAFELADNRITRVTGEVTVAFPELAS